MWLGVAVVAFVVAGCGSPEQPVAMSLSASAEQEMTPSERIAYGPGFNVDEANRTVTKVVDGDTFEVTGGQRVRVLGIDSCEMSTVGGAEAKETATNLLSHGVALRSQPGAPDKDRYGRLLRYVMIGGGDDFGEAMVRYDHTGVYAGKNDASPEYVTKLREIDFMGRNCAGEAAQLAANTDHTYIPVPIPHGDNHKSRFCRRHIWC